MEDNFKPIIKAKELATHTFKLTSNCNRYPKKYRFSLVDKMQNKTLELYEYLFEANRTDLSTHKAKRFELQSSAINYCDELLFYIELSLELGIINSESVEYWTKMVTDVKYLTLAWRKRDRER